MLTNRFQKTMFSWLAPACQQCGLALHAPTKPRLCAACLAWYAPTPRCARCGLPCESATAQCGQCLSTPPPWHQLVCVGDYRFPLSHSVHQLKYQRQFWQARPLAALLAPRITTPAPLLTCVPLHWRRQLRRGFNQSDVLARQLAQHLGCEYDPQLFSRPHATVPQHGLDKAQRRRNLNRAFVLNHVPCQQHVAIVDDVVTTGSTVRQLCNLLLEVGVKSLDIYCICRTPEPSD